MAPPSLPSPETLLAARFRANPAFGIVVFDRLPEEYRQELAALAEDPDNYGVLWPQTAGLTVKAIDRETALLCYTLSEPGHLPDYVRRALGGELVETMFQLVLDDVLQIEIDGEFVSGVAAQSHLAPRRAATEGDGRIAELSLAALRYATRLETDSARQLALWLYQFNSVPASSGWRRRLPDEDLVLDYVGLAAGSAARRRLDGVWEEAAPSESNRGWRSWSRRDARRAGARTEPGYKLYVSPQPGELGEALPEVVDALSASRARAFKIGRDLAGLLRPDKMVAYFDDFEALAEAVDVLRHRVGERPAQGVPFTATIDADGLYSWGMDPPGRQAGWPEERESWRLWVINRLAVALLAARTADGEHEPWRFALERIEREGVNITTWAPKQTLWEAAGG